MSASGLTCPSIRGVGWRDGGLPSLSPEYLTTHQVCMLQFGRQVGARNRGIIVFIGTERLGCKSCAGFVFLVSLDFRLLSWDLFTYE